MGNGSLIYKMIIDLWLVSMLAWRRSVIVLFSHPIRTVWQHRNSKTIVKFWSVVDIFIDNFRHLDRSLNVEIVVEYHMIFVVVFLKYCCEIHFGAPSRSRKGWVISLQ